MPTGPAEASSGMRKCLGDAVAAAIADGISFTEFIREAKAVWKLNSSDVNVCMTDYNRFVKETMPSVRAANPNSTNSTRMKIIGEMWRAKKQA